MELISITEASSRVIEKCARLYCEIWREPPWNEDFWTEDRVIYDLREQMGRPKFHGFAAIGSTKDCPELVGFSWGYQASAKELEGISGINESLWKTVIGDKPTFYVDELGVSYQCRRNGVGEEISRGLIKRLPALGITYVTLRTAVKASAARRLYSKLGFKELPLTDMSYSDRTYWLLPLQ